MSDPELVYTTALAELRAAEKNYGDAEDRLIRARRAVSVAEFGTKYRKMLDSCWRGGRTVSGDMM